jgi:hypothetical protein
MDVIGNIFVTELLITCEEIGNGFGTLVVTIKLTGWFKSTVNGDTLTRLNEKLINDAAIESLPNTGIVNLYILLGIFPVANVAVVPVEVNVDIG